jgi:hypothetical protein
MHAHNTSAIHEESKSYLPLFHVNNITRPSINANPGIFTIRMLKQYNIWHLNNKWKERSQKKLFFKWKKALCRILVRFGRGITIILL